MTAKTIECAFCAKTLPALGRRSIAALPCCGRKRCQKASHAASERRRRARVKEEREVMRKLLHIAA